MGIKAALNWYLLKKSTIQHRKISV